MTLHHVSKKMIILSMTSVILYLTTMVVAKVLKRILPKYNEKHAWILNLLKLCVCVVSITLVGYWVRQIPSLIHLPLKSADFNPHNVKEIKGTILVGPAFMFVLAGTLKEYLSLFE